MNHKRKPIKTTEQKIAEFPAEERLYVEQMFDGRTIGDPDWETKNIEYRRTARPEALLSMLQAGADAVEFAHDNYEPELYEDISDEEYLNGLGEKEEYERDCKKDSDGGLL